MGRQLLGFCIIACNTSWHTKPEVTSTVLEYHPHPIGAESSVCANGRCWVECCYAVIVPKPQFTIYGFKNHVNAFNAESAVDTIGHLREVGVVLMRATFVGEP